MQYCAKWCFTYEPLEVIVAAVEQDVEEGGAADGRNVEIAAPARLIGLRF